jgi:hypothetical protein
MVKPCLSVCALYLKTPECTSVRFGIGDLHKILSGKFNVGLYQFSIVATLHEVQIELY